MYNTIDLHCDTVWVLYEKGGELSRNNFHVDMEKLKKGGAAGQVFAAYVYMGREGLSTEEYFAYAERLMERFYSEIGRNPGIEPALSYEDHLKNREKGYISAFLSLEEGGVVGEDLDKIDLLYDKGVRMVTLTWNFPNSIGYPNKDYKYSERGLTSFGRKAVEYMDQKGIIIDVSHLSDRGFYDVADIVKGPFTASHSNCRGLHDHPRNLTDDMIRTIADHGGVIGVNFAAHFLAQKEKSHVEDIVRHVSYMRSVGGIGCCAVGGDLDGISSTLEIGDYSGMQNIYRALVKSGFSQEECEKTARLNVERFFSDKL